MGSSSSVSMNTVHKPITVSTQSSCRKCVATHHEVLSETTSLHESAKSSCDDAISERSSMRSSQFAEDFQRLGSVLPGGQQDYETVSVAQSLQRSYHDDASETSSMRSSQFAAQFQNLASLLPSTKQQYEADSGECSD